MYFNHIYIQLDNKTSSFLLFFITILFVQIWKEKREGYNSVKCVFFILLVTLYHLCSQSFFHPHSFPSTHINTPVHIHTDPSTFICLRLCLGCPHSPFLLMSSFVEIKSRSSLPFRNRKIPLFTFFYHPGLNSVLDFWNSNSFNRISWGSTILLSMLHNG